MRYKLKKILVITRSPWLTDNSTGRTLYDFFCESEGLQIFSLCLREAPCVCQLSQKNFYISETQLINAIINKGFVGRITEKHCNEATNSKEEEKIYSISKQLNFTILNFAREILWSINSWKNDRLNAFLDDVCPDVVFFPDFTCVYAHKVLDYIYKRTNAKIIIFHTDDCYTLKQFSISPLYWVYRFWLRKWVRNSVKISKIHYVISDVQKKDYDKCFNVENKILTKFLDFDIMPVIKQKYNFPLQLVYTGNINLNRWKSLAIISKVIKTINENEIRLQLRIYTTNQITKSIQKVLEIPNSSFLMGKKPAEEMEKIQTEADILVHVEPMDIKNRLRVRQSFSTKIVDYLKRGRAILAVGTHEVASIKHLEENECAIIANNEKQLIDELKRIIENPIILNNYAIKAYDCGRMHHNRKGMLSMLYQDINS